MPPKKYRPEFCQVVIKEMMQGASVDSVGCRLISEDHPSGVSRATVYNWIKEYPEFGEAIELGNQLAQLRLERGLNAKASGAKDSKNIDYQSSQFLLKTRFHKTYSEKIITENVDVVEKYEDYLKRIQKENP